MRSRYSAFVLNNAAYLLATWHPDTRPNELTLDETNWIGLTIKHTREGLSGDSEGWVHFVARYKEGGKAYRLEENSHFEKLDERWYYTKPEP